MLKRIFRGCVAVLLMLQLVFVGGAIAMAQPSPHSAPETLREEGQLEPEVTPSTNTSQPRNQQTLQGQQLTYPEPPDVYDYESLRQYDEEIYGEQEILKQRQQEAIQEIPNVFLS